jgi:hypothetical protein
MGPAGGERTSGPSSVRVTLLGIGAMASPRHAPAGLLVEHRGQRVMLDGGPGAEPEGRLDAWLVTDPRAELIGAIRRLAAARGLAPRVAGYRRGGLHIAPRRVLHTAHPTYGYLIATGRHRIVWAPEFLRFPAWAAGAALVFADAAGWDRPIRFAGGVGGHAPVRVVATAAGRRHVGRLVFAHLGRPTLRALDTGQRPAFGEIGVEGRTYRPRAPRMPALRGRARPRAASTGLARGRSTRRGCGWIHKRSIAQYASDSGSATTRRRSAEPPRCVARSATA